MGTELGLRWAFCQASAPGEVRCGDRVACLTPRRLRPPDADGPLPDPVRQWLVVVDALGHGPEAADVADAALAALMRPLSDPAHPAFGDDPATALLHLDQVLSGGRGAAVGLALRVGQELRHAAVGNTRLLHWRAGQVLRLPSRYGIVGERRLSRADLTVQTLALQAGDSLLLFTDGLAENLSLPTISAAWRQDPQAMATDLLARWRQPRDDAAVLVVHVEAASACR